MTSATLEIPMLSETLAAVNDAACTADSEWPDAIVFIVMIIAFAAFMIAVVRS